MRSDTTSIRAAVGSTIAPPMMMQTAVACRQRAGRSATRSVTRMNSTGSEGTVSHLVTQADQFSGSVTPEQGEPVGTAVCTGVRGSWGRGRCQVGHR